MILNINATFPSSRCYVMKLHRDSLPGQGQLRGRLEHIESGYCIDFDSGEQLLAWICQHVNSLDARPMAGEAQ